MGGYNTEPAAESSREKHSSPSKFLPYASAFLSALLFHVGWHVAEGRFSRHAEPAPLTTAEQIAAGVEPDLNAAVVVALKEFHENIKRDLSKMKGEMREHVEACDEQHPQVAHRVAEELGREGFEVLNNSGTFIWDRHVGACEIIVELTPLYKE